MKLRWSVAGRADLDRLHDFLAQYSLDAADAAFDVLVNAPKRLGDFPRRGSRMNEFDPREVREFRVSTYVVRYELRGSEIIVLRIFHGREDRF